MEEQTRTVEMMDITLKAAAFDRFYSLLMLNGPGRGATFRLAREGEFTIGRGKDCNLCIDDSSVSRVHARILVKPDGIYVVDAGSTNGTFVDSLRLEPSRIVQVSEGSKLRVGDQVMLRVNRSDQLDEEFSQAMYEAAVKDALTGVFNKRYAAETLRRDMALCHRHGVDLSVVMIDVDCFKAINDKFGHQAGDFVLEHLAKSMARTLRAEDLLARFGGEEFFLLIRNQPLKEVALAAERLRALVERTVFRVRDQIVPITISLGVASTGARFYDSAESLVADADMMLYQAKKDGRNCWRAATSTALGVRPPGRLHVS